MPKSMVSNTKLIELLEYYVLTQQRELPEEFNQFNIPEGRNALLKLVQQRLRKLPEEPVTEIKPKPEQPPTATKEMLVRDVFNGFDRNRSLLLEWSRTLGKIESGKYGTLLLSGLPGFTGDWEHWRTILLQLIWMFMDHLSSSMRKWPNYVAKPEVLFEEMVFHMTTDVVMNMSKGERCVLIIGQPENMDRADKLIDVEALHRLKKGMIELDGKYSGWTVQTVPEARFHE